MIRVVVDDFQIRAQRHARKQSLEEIVAEQRIFRLARQRCLERINVVIPPT